MERIYERIGCKSLLSRVATADIAVEIIESGMSVAVSSDLIPICNAIEKKAQNDRDFKIELWSGVAMLWADRRLGMAGTLTRRIGQQTLLRKSINSRDVKYLDTPLGSFYQSLRRGDFGKLDVAIVEAVRITPEGNLIPSYRLADMANFVEAAKEVIVQLNLTCPLEIEGIHDVFVPLNPPNKNVISITRVDDRIGTTYIPVDPEKIRYIVPSDLSEASKIDGSVDDVSRKIAENVVAFFEKEVAMGNLPPNLLPIEIGLGRIPTAILQQLGASLFKNLEFYSAILDERVFDLIDNGKLRAATGSGMVLSFEGEKKLFDNLARYKEHIVLRPVEITDSPEVVGRLGVLALNSAVEVDIYGHVNSSHLLQGDIVSGIGGAGDFAFNAYLSVISLPSVTKNGDISCIVPMVPHVDIPEQGVHVIVTEQGVADLRGLAPTERAERIIENCAHPEYRSSLKEYFQKAKKDAGGHEPQLLSGAFSFHLNLLKTGSMRRSIKEE